VGDTSKNIRLGIFVNLSIGVVFIIAAVIVVAMVNYNMRQQALVEAQSKARIILDRNLATHTYFSHIMKPSIFAWSEPFRTKDYFDQTWMSSTYAIREIEKYFKSLNPSGYYFRDAAINARSPENEADEYEGAFIKRLNSDNKLESDTAVRNINGKPYLVVLRRGETMEASCLRCHSDPKNAPKGLTDYYGSERSFYRSVGDAVSAVSIRIPLSEAYAAANMFSLKLSIILLIVLACLFIIQYLLYNRYLLQPIYLMRDKAKEIAMHEQRLGEQIPSFFGRELYELSSAFNKMSETLKSERDHLEETVNKRTEDLLRSEAFQKAIIKSSPVALFSIDLERNIQTWNESAKQMFGWSTEEVLGKPLPFIPEHMRAEHDNLFVRVMSGENIYGLELVRQRKDGSYFNISLSASKIIDAKGKVIGLLGAVQDITEQKRLEKHLQTMSLTDELTGLYNRRGFITLAEQQLKIAERTKKDILLFFVDLDKMKQINDTFGHQTGDRALVDISNIFKEVFRESDIIGRIGGDEFAILAIDVTDETKTILIKRLYSTINAFNNAEGRNYQLSLSIGIASYNPEKPSTLDELMAQADEMMYAEKNEKSDKNR